MIEIDGASDPLPHLCRERSPCAIADPLAPYLGVVHPVGEDVRVGGGDDQVVEVAVRLVTDPLPFVVVEDRSPALVQDSSHARVHDDDAVSPEVPMEAPPRAIAIALRVFRVFADD